MGELTLHFDINDRWSECSNLYYRLEKESQDVYKMIQDYISQYHFDIDENRFISWLQKSKKLRERFLQCFWISMEYLQKFFDDVEDKIENYTEDSEKQRKIVFEVKSDFLKAFQELEKPAKKAFSQKSLNKLQEAYVLQFNWWVYGLDLVDISDVIQEYEKLSSFEQEEFHHLKLSIARLKSENIVVHLSKNYPAFWWLMSKKLRSKYSFKK